MVHGTRRLLGFLATGTDLDGGAPLVSLFWSTTPWFQSDHEFLSPLRHVLFRGLQHVGPARRFMTRTMAGLVGGR